MSINNENCLEFERSSLIRTSRLELVLQSAELIRMEIGNPASLGQALDAVVPAAWPPESVGDVLEFFKAGTGRKPEHRRLGGLLLALHQGKRRTTYTHQQRRV